MPHGGAANIPAKEGLSIHVMKRAWPCLVVKSATMIGAIELSFLWSTPKAERTFNAFKAAVTRPDPAKSSITIGPVLTCFLWDEFLNSSRPGNEL